MDLSKSTISTHAAPHDFFANAAKGSLQFSNLRELNEKINACTTSAFHDLPNYSRYFQQGQMHLVVDHVKSCRVSILGLLVGLFRHGFQWVVDTFQQNKVLDKHVKELNVLAVKVEHCLVDRALKTLGDTSDNIIQMLSTELDSDQVSHFKACMKELERVRADAIRAVRLYEAMGPSVGVSLEGLDKTSILSAADLAHEQGLIKLQQHAIHVIQSHSHGHGAPVSMVPKPMLSASTTRHAPSPPTGAIRATLPTAPAPVDPLKGIPTVLCGGKKTALGARGIGNPNCACYTIAALQSIRFNPQLRHLVDRKLPSQEYFNGKMLSISPQKYRELESFQRQLRDIFDRLDRGQKIPESDMQKLNAYMYNTLEWHSRLPEQADSSECYSWILDKLLFHTPDEEVLSTGAQAVASTVVTPSNLGAQLRTSYLLDMTSLELKEGHGLEGTVVLGGGTTNDAVIPIELVKASPSRGEPERSATRVDFSASNPIQTLQALHSGATPHHDLFTIKPEDRSELAQTLREHVHVPFDPTIHTTGVVVEKMVEVKGSGPTLKKFYAGPAVSRIDFCNAPPTLMFSLKRFEHIGHGGHPVRLDGPVEIPMEMDLSTLATQTTGARPSSDSMVYQLASVTVHAGSAGGGHYYMYRRTDDGSWICCNDAQVSRVPDFDPSKLEGSYILTYEKKPPAQAQVLV